MKSLFPILLCLLLLPLTACQPDFSGSRMGTPRGLHMSYTAFHTTEKQTLSLKAGEEIALSLVSQAGTLSITIWKGEEESIYEGEGLTTQDFTVEVVPLSEGEPYTLIMDAQDTVLPVTVQHARYIVRATLAGEDGTRYQAEYQFILENGE